MAPTLVPEREAADYLGGISLQTLRNWRISGRGPVFLKLGKSVRYSLADLDVFIQQSRREPDRALEARTAMARM